MTEINEKRRYIENLCASSDSCEDDDILELQSNLNNIDKEFRDLRDIRDKFENLISGFDDKEIIMQDVVNKYATINNKIITYNEKIKQEVKKRELEDYRLNAVTKLNIQVPKFSGIDQKIDIHSRLNLKENMLVYQKTDVYIN